MTLRPVLAALITAITLAAGGCGGSDDPKDKPSAPTVSAKPATGDAVTGTGYSFKAPKDWHKPKKKIPGFDPDALVLDTTDKDGFADNVNVLRIAVPQADVDTLERANVESLKGAHATKIKVLHRQTVAGETAVHLTCAENRNGVEYRADQFFMIHDHFEYAITFSASATVSRADQDTIAQSVMASWKWAS